MNFRKNKKVKLFVAAGCLLLAALFTKEKATHMISSSSVGENNRIVIDAGHGGGDSGKAGVNDALEKDINLAIAKYLKELLTGAGFDVTMTRETSDDLASEDAANHKAEDLRMRCRIISDTDPVFTVSIHQNSYSDPSVKGAQVFYYASSAAGKELAETLQSALVECLNPENTRQAKANDTYYMLKKSDSPTVIVECGFLSNPEEAALLVTEEYQQQVAAAILEGIETYLDDSSGSTDVNSGTPQ